MNTNAQESQRAVDRAKYRNLVVSGVMYVLATHWPNIVQH